MGRGRPTPPLRHARILRAHQSLSDGPRADVAIHVRCIPVPLRRSKPERELEYALVAIVALAAWAYLYVGARRVYGLAPARAGLGAAAITFGGLPVILMGYRVLLFWLTLWTLDLPKV